MLDSRRVNTLTLRFPDAASSDLVLEPGVHTVGRGTDGRLVPAARHDAMLQVSVDRRGAWLQVRDGVRGVHVNGRPVRRVALLRAGDVVFLAENNYVGIILEVRSKTEIQALVGWLPGTQGKRHSRVLRLDLPIHVLAVADPHIPIKQRVARPALTANDRKEIANLLSQHPAVGTFVPPQHFESAYARWQRYLGYEEKATGQVDEKSLTRLTKEMER